jgi:hypothetical protein
MGFLLALGAACLAQQRPQLRVAWGPVLSDETSKSVAVGWATNMTSSSRVVCGGKAFRSRTTGLYHRVVIAGLRPGKTYRYAVEASAPGQKARTAAYLFHTPPARLASWSFAVFGDTRSGHQAHRSVVAAILRASPRPWLAVNTGDLVAEGSKAPEWDTFFDIERSLLATLPYYPCMGNHEQDSQFYYDLFPVPSGGGPHRRAWYSFRFGGALFVGLDSEKDLAAQAPFLEAQAGEAEKNGVRWKFAFFHEPAYSSGTHGGSVPIQNAWVPVLRKHRFTAVFCGHDHVYEHSLADGVNYFTSGGGGAPLYSVGAKPNPYSVKAVSTYHYIQVLVRPTLLQVRAITPSGELIDRVVIK